ncbi:MAG: ABC transporter ATP-binding protein [Candidatus Omnitrophica bacterium]|nr:ABC transporter ATP-binding protein [Candidatus Omnitrophota bacterium]
MLKIQGLKKNYEKKEAVKGIDLEIREGELFSLLGPNGAGKTTTLKMLVGLLKPTSGEIRIGGFDIVRNPIEAKKIISFVPDVPYIYDKLTPWEFLRFIGKLYAIEPKTSNDRAAELLKFFEMWSYRDVLIEEFSHGMKQKIILSGALLPEPKVFILDEPMVGLDPVSIHSFKEMMKRKAKEGMTIIFSTHTLAWAEELADRIGIIHQGRLISLGTLSQLQQQFQSRENLEEMFMSLVAKENESV